MGYGKTKADGQGSLLLFGSKYFDLPGIGNGDFRRVSGTD